MIEKLEPSGKTLIAPAEQARLKAGLSLPVLAKRLGLRAKSSPRYLRTLELNGGAPLHLAENWARHVNADANLILHSPAYLRALAAVQSEQQQERQQQLSERLPQRMRKRREPMLIKI